MAYSGDLLKINGVKVVGLKAYDIQREKLWKDAERNMSGGLRSSFIGIFPKLNLTFRDALDEAQIRQIEQLLDTPFISVEYFDEKHDSTRTAQYYAASYTTSLMNKTRGLYKGFTVNLIPVEREA